MASVAASARCGRFASAVTAAASNGKAGISQRFGTIQFI